MAVGLCAEASAAERPNIVFIYADDLGYGDVQCLNPERGKIATPKMDQLAVEGMVFTDAHTSEKEKPFFLYVPFGSPHTPIVPTKEWQGKSGLGDYGDFVMQTDAGVGDITDAFPSAELR